MSVPGIVQSTLNGEEIAARVSLGGEDELFITPSSTLVYTSEGLLSDESVKEYPHEADRLTLSEGRRKTKFTLEYALEGTRSFSVPAGKTDDVLHPVLAGVLNGNGITDPGETVVKTYRFSELTLIITSDRLVKHIGGAVWDGDYEEYHFENVTNLAFEDGSVATQIVLTADGRPQRIKAPNEEANDLRERLQRALFEYHDVGSLEELNRKVGVEEDADQAQRRASVDFGEGVDPLDANPPEIDDRETVESHTESTLDGDGRASDPLADPSSTAGADSQQQRTQSASQASGRPDSSSSHEQTAATGEDDTAFELSDETVAESDPTLERSEPTETDAGQAEADTDLLAESTPLLETDSEPLLDVDARDTDSGVATDELADRLDSLEAAVDRQNELIEHQQQTIEQLIAELKRSR